MNYLLAFALVLCLGAGAFMVARSPAFWISLVSQVGAILLPAIKQILTKRMPPEQEAELHKSIRRGQQWDNFNKRPRDK